MSLGLRSRDSYGPTLGRWGNVAVHKAIENRPRRVGRADSEAFVDVLDGYSEYDTAFAHVGLSDVNTALDGDPYENVRDGLDAAFDAVLAPGFTDYFKLSGVYDKQHSRPKHGTFGRLFLRDADGRTDDAMRSILVRGDYDFQDRDHRNTFAPEGCFEQLHEDDVLFVSIGTPWLVCSYLHHLEAKHDVPYVRHETFEGVMYDDGDRVDVEQRTHVQDGLWFFNKLRLHRLLRRHDALDEYDLDGLSVFVSPVSQVDALVSEKLRRDPYYLVTL